MFKRKHKLINRKFQLKSVFTVMSISAVTITCAVLIMLIITANNSRSMKESVDDLNKAISVENSIIESFVEFEQAGANTAFVMKIAEIRSDHENTIKQVWRHVSGLESVIMLNHYIIIAIIVLFFLQSIIFCFYLIHFTHRIAGPVQVITRYMEKIINGEKAGFRALRDRDELKEFHDKFIEMVKKIECVQEENPLEGNEHQASETDK
jgi:predicted PurR-regulated permease PerM